jgi:hypothetical protein
MADLVAAFGAPHTPRFPLLVKDEPHGETAQLYGELRSHLEAVKPDVLVVFDSDHFNTFFLNNLPLMCVGVTDQTSGPNDATPGLAKCVVPVNEALGEHVRATGIVAGFDLALSQDFDVDHSVLVPLHFLTPAFEVPIVPIFIAGLLPPLPQARRCLALGEMKMVARAIASWPRAWRVAILASGSFSLEIGGPKMHPAAWAAVPDEQWVRQVVGYLRAGQTAELLNEATADRIQAAGNIGGELLNWVALLGCVGDRTPGWLEPQVHEGHAYGAWRWD